MGNAALIFSGVPYTCLNQCDICKPENLQQYPWIWNHWKMLKCLSKQDLLLLLELSLNGTMLPMWGWLWSWKISFTSLKKISCLKMRFNLEKLGFWMCQDVKSSMFPWRHDKQFSLNFILKSRHCEKATKFGKISHLLWRLLQCVEINPDLNFGQYKSSMYFEVWIDFLENWKKKIILTLAVLLFDYFSNIVSQSLYSINYFEEETYKLSWLKIL